MRERNIRLIYLESSTRARRMANPSHGCALWFDKWWLSGHVKSSKVNSFDMINYLAESCHSPSLLQNELQRDRPTPSAMQWIWNAKKAFTSMPIDSSARVATRTVAPRSLSPIQPPSHRRFIVRGAFSLPLSFCLHQINYDLR